ncbi:MULTISPECIES: hypothetical protein [unclassified Rhizobium]
MDEEIPPALTSASAGAHGGKLESNSITVKYNIRVGAYFFWYNKRKECDF